MSLKDKWNNARNGMRGARGRNIATFSIFLVIATILWCVLMLNEENQMEVRCRIRLLNVPDSITLISKIPEDITAAVQARNSTLLFYSWNDDPVVDVDFDVFSAGNRILVQPADFKGLVRARIGGQSVISSMSPDSLSLYYTTRPPVMLPVEVDGRITIDQQAQLAGPIIVEPDTVAVYSIDALKPGTVAIPTENFRLNNLTQTTTVAVQLVAPRYARLIPATVTITIPVEQLVACTAEVAVEAANVPYGLNAVVFPATVGVNYRVPESQVDSIPDFKVTVNYRDLPAHPVPGASYRMKAHFKSDSDLFTHIAIEPDSVECIFEKN